MEPLDVCVLHCPPHLGPKEGQTFEISMTLCTLGLPPLLVAPSLAARAADVGFMVNGAPGRIILFDGPRAAGGWHHE